MRLKPTWTLGVLGMAVLLQGCAGARFKLDSATNACRTQPASCAQAAGQESILPWTIRAVGTAGGSTVAAAKLLDEALLKQVTEAMTECADKARAEVILEHFGTRSPTREECMEVGTDKKRKTFTRAMLLGEQMHRIALLCAAEKLNELQPGRFNLDPTYKYDPDSKKTTWLSPDKVDIIRRDGNFFELKGSLVPDVVLHEGHPERVQAVYDFKFPCIDLSQHPRWREYAPGHPYAGRNQNEIYIEAFKTSAVFRVSPWIGASF
ncbi:hypothetical protein OV207_04555 [Corallococcus sp. BB11-1]|uniref:hypothetical protein n=1 Tax=Corallococcus sp. BB11-1 TaxID=2996783 RepID=UPI00226EB0C6|nr:hypothetical protein [Corallococcus sp. BB11-1]MCY1030716.1 hypothetical protein [Corallococcus sp. BB11-1]